MFEKYTEPARRAVFAARYEASAVGSKCVDTEHLLLGLFRAHGDPLTTLLRQKTTSDQLRAQIFDIVPIEEYISTSVDLPLSSPCKRILAYAREEALGLSHTHIGTEHLMLGILREPGCLAEKLLTGYGFSLDQARALVSFPDTPATPATPAAAASSIFAGPVPGPSSGPAPTRPAGRFLLIELVDAITGTRVSTLANVFIVPRIGDLIVIHDEQPRSFRVQDVVWNFQPNSDATTLYEITIQGLEQNTPSE
jgi:hypothetical protein